MVRYLRIFFRNSFDSIIFPVISIQRQHGFYCKFVDLTKIQTFFTLMLTTLLIDEYTILLKIYCAKRIFFKNSLFSIVLRVRNFPENITTKNLQHKTCHLWMFLTRKLIQLNEFRKKIYEQHTIPYGFLNGFICYQ